MRSKLMIMDFATQSAIVAVIYGAILEDLPHNFLTIHKLTSAAKGCEKYGPTIVDTITEYILKVEPDLQLTIFQLIDWLLNYTTPVYIELINESIVHIFCEAYKEMDAVRRKQLYQFRNKWDKLLSLSVLCELDDCVYEIDLDYPGVEPVVSFPNLSLWANQTAAGKQAEIVELKKRQHLVNQNYELLKLFMSKNNVNDKRNKRSIKEIAVEDEEPMLKKAKTEKINGLFGTIDVDVLIPPMEQMKLSNIESADKSEAKNVKANRIKLL